MEKSHKEFLLSLNFNLNWIVKAVQYHSHFFPPPHFTFIYMTPFSPSASALLLKWFPITGFITSLKNTKFICTSAAWEITLFRSLSRSLITHKAVRLTYLHKAKCTPLFSILSHYTFADWFAWLFVWGDVALVSDNLDLIGFLHHEMGLASVNLRP